MRADDPWLPLDAAGARELARRIAAQRPPTQPPRPPQQAANDGPERTPGQPHAVRVTATLKAPARALAIWSPGPDGRDNGGRITYDPTNGTFSGGDVIVYPEGY